MIPSPRSLLLVLVCALALPLRAAAAQNCPAPLDGALRLVLVTAPSMAERAAMLRIFQRESVGASWQALGPARPAVVGQAGMGWGFTFREFRRDGEPVKTEGDQRAPAGFFQIGASFGFMPLARSGHVVLKAGETVCVDDPSSPDYNTISTRKRIGPQVHGEDMGRISLYRRGLFVDYPSDRASRAGSCIFIHIWRGPGHGTAGCVALPEAHVAEVQEFSEPGAVLAVLPETALARFADCLPVAKAN